MIIRPEEPGDLSAIRALNLAAFERDDEGQLVDQLRQRAVPYISLVAVDGQEIVGHIVFTPVVITGREHLSLMGLAPMAVVPSRQRGGVGSALVLEGLDACRAAGAGAIVVLGHAEYYPRFGFVPASRFGIASDYDVPDEVFMALELADGYLEGASGTARYHEAFGG